MRSTRNSFCKASVETACDSSVGSESSSDRAGLTQYCCQPVIEGARARVVGDDDSSDHPPHGAHVLAETWRGTIRGDDRRDLVSHTWKCRRRAIPSIGRSGAAGRGGTSRCDVPRGASVDRWLRGGRCLLRYLWFRDHCSHPAPARGLEFLFRSVLCAPRDAPHTRIEPREVISILQQRRIRSCIRGRCR